MALYEMSSSELREIDSTSFGEMGIQERQDLQRLLREQVKIISPETLIIAEEFGEWEDSKRRIDLLGIDKNANLVVIELKRTDDGGHMELQALRYAAMVSAMTFEKAVDLYRRHLARNNGEEDAQALILDFLYWDEPNEDRFAQDVRIVLASADFSRELTTCVIWLNDRGLDIRCVRMKPHRDDGRVLIDVQQVLPLPEAAAYQVQIREKEQRERQDQKERHILRYLFWEGLLPRAQSKTDLHANISPSRDNWVATSAGMQGLGLLSYAIRKDNGSVEFYIDQGAGKAESNKRVFDMLKENEEQIESQFGERLKWERLDDKRACRISYMIFDGGYKDSEAEWPDIQDKMIEAMVRFEAVLRPWINKATSLSRVLETERRPLGDREMGG